MTKLDPNRTPSEKGFELALRHACLAGACRAVATRRPESAEMLLEEAEVHHQKGRWFLAQINDVQSRRGGFDEVL